MKTKNYVRRPIFYYHHHNFFFNSRVRVCEQRTYYIPITMSTAHAGKAMHHIIYIKIKTTRWAYECQRVTRNPFQLTLNHFFFQIHICTYMLNIFKIIYKMTNERSALERATTAKNLKKNYFILILLFVIKILHACKDIFF